MRRIEELPPSPRQLEALRAVALTGSRREAAKLMGIAEQTLDNHLTELYWRLRVPNILEALLHLGWLQLPPLTTEKSCYHPCRHCALAIHGQE